MEVAAKVGAKLIKVGGATNKCNTKKAVFQTMHVIFKNWFLQMQPCGSWVNQMEKSQYSVRLEQISLFSNNFSATLSLQLLFQQPIAPKRTNCTSQSV